MQASGASCFLHSCLDCIRNTVMGCCYSLCHKDENPQESGPSERTRLLEVPEPPHEVPVQVANTTPPKKQDEQSALNKILHETAVNVIDVGALGPYTLEPAVYQDRVRAYSARLSVIPAPVVQTPKLLADVSHNECVQILSSSPPRVEEINKLTESVKRAGAAMSGLRVKHHEELVVPFRVP